MKRRDLLVIVGVAGVTIVALIVLLVTGGAAPITEFEDPEADVVVEEGPNQPEETALADLVAGSVSRSGDEIVFEAVLAADVPEEIEDGSLVFRWDVSTPEAAPAWIVSANLDLGPHASVVSADTTKSYSTFTQSEHPHEEVEDGVRRVGAHGLVVEVEGKALRVRFTPPGDAGFPSSFDWTLTTTLDGDAGDAGSPVATDHVPDEGGGQLVE